MTSILGLEGRCFPAVKGMMPQRLLLFGQLLRRTQEPAPPNHCWPLPRSLLVVVLPLSLLCCHQICHQRLEVGRGFHPRLLVSHQQKDQKSAGDNTCEMRSLVFQPSYYIYQSTNLVTKIIQNGNSSLEYFPLLSGTRQRGKVSQLL